VAPEDHQPAVGEIKRILKPEGKAYLSTIRGSISYVNDEEWEAMLGEFKVEERNDRPYRRERWAIVSKTNLEE
jgi:hypothetical protein